MMLHEGKLSVLFKNGRSPYQKADDFYVSLHTPIPNWQKEQWHHLAITWQSKTPGYGMLEMYVDGQLVDQHNNLKLGRQFISNTLAIGRSSAQNSKKSNLLIDEFYLSRTAWTAQQISDLYKANKQGRKFEPPAASLLYQSFEKTTAQ